MEKTHFPGYHRCTACEEIISEKEIREHILHNCRGKSSNEKKSCAFCNKQIPIKELQQHVESCQLADNGENNDTGYETPRAQTPTQIEKNPQIEIINSTNKQTKRCVLCSQLIDEDDYGNHVQSCSNDQHQFTYKNNNNYNENNNYQQIDDNSLKTSNISKKKETKVCSLCSKSFDESEYQDHVQSCSIDQNYPSRQLSNNTNINNDTKNSYPKRNSSPYSSQNDLNSSKRSNTYKKKQTKLCSLCSQSFDESDYADHVQFCSNNQIYSSDQLLNNTHTDNHTENLSNSKRNSSQYSSQSDKKSIISKSKQRKICGLCSGSFDESEYEGHVESCSNDEQSPDNRSTMIIDNESSRNSSTIPKTRNNQTKTCGFCREEIDQSEYRDHVQFCSVEPPTNNYSHIETNSNKNHKQKTSRKECVICFQSVDESEYVDHVTCCSSEQDANRGSHNDNNNNKKHKQKSGKKECVICFESFDESEYMNHVQSCSSQLSPSIQRNTYQTNSFDRSTTTSNCFTNDDEKPSIASGGVDKTTRRDCIICFKSIDISEYENHVLACVAQTEQHQSLNSTTRNKLKCLTCNRSINKEDNLHYEMACHSHHIHCLTCLRNSMEEFARNREAPVCHKRLCDYELSRHDISSIPLERRLSDRLLKLSKGQQRPLCLKCNFYININDNENFDEHVESCDDLIPCEYCQFPYPFKQLENHTLQCRSDTTSHNEKLINFVLTRTKYPFTKEQIRIFIQQQSKNPRNQLDPSSIIEALAIFGPTFPYEIPTRECGVCMESRPYDDIYVFDCDESHKLCYDCYYQSCQAKMNAGEILTCALCTHPLRDGELNQLRIPINELQKIRDYQMKKTFEVYSSRTRGIIKCPNQNCTWVAEAADPNERFRVQCPQCQSEFCSLCNQQYHYRTNCQQLPQITQRWFFWCENERTRYLTMRAQQDTEYATRLADYNRQTNESNNRNKDLRRRYEELMNDEQYKVQNCRLCPHCKRVVQRLEGCDSMICGQDAHGGNVQSGCGKKFNWTQAQAYTAAATQQPRQIIVDLPKPDNPVVHHNGVKCDLCQNDVNGIRFDCVHCPSLTFCEKCEQQATLNHSRENEAFGQQQHVFKLIMIPEDEAIQL